MAHGRSLVGAISFLLLLTGVPSAEPYEIGPGDVLALRVLEWQALENRTVEWGAMSAELAVDADGMVTVPFLGRLEAQNLAPSRLSEIITEGLRQRFAISSVLDATVQVERYRPVYVSGAVRTPGEYPFRPGLTAAQLLAQAGGSVLGTTNGEIDVRDIIGREGQIALLDLEGERLAIRRAMLQAAIEGRSEIVQPQMPAAAVWSPTTVDSENQVLRLRQERRERDLLELDDQIRLLRAEIEALTGRGEALERLLDSARREYDNAQSLAERGLAAVARVAETERTLALAEAQILDVSTAVLRARQGITLAEAEKVALRDRELIDDTRQLQQVEEGLDSVLTAIQTQRRLLMAETGSMLIEDVIGDDAARAEPVVTIRRGLEDGTIQLSGLETVLAPGDVVNVVMPRMAARRSGDSMGPVGQ